MRNFVLLGIFFLTINTSSAQVKVEKDTIVLKQKKDLINDEKTAIKIAKVIWFSVYGDRIYTSKPFKAKLIKNNTVWFIEGTLNYDYGGVPFMELRSKDCKVLRFGHSK